MAVGPKPEESPGIRSSDVAISVARILPPVLYEEPVFADVVIPASQWTLLANRDYQRAAFVLFRNAGNFGMKIRSGGNPVACPFIIDKTTTNFTLLYLDYLTIVIGELYGWSDAGETVTVCGMRML